MKQKRLGTVGLRVALPLCPGLDPLLSRSLLGWEGSWEPGHAIRLSAELFIPGR